MFRRPPEADDDELFAKPTVIALADVALCLLVIVLSTGAAAVQQALVALPDARNVVARDINLSVSLTVHKDGKYFFEDVAKPIEGKNLWAALKEIKQDNRWTSAIIRADQTAPFEHVELATQCLYGLGVDEVMFAMKEQGQ
jgi:biopolymer transport protein ExbD